MRALVSLLLLLLAMPAAALVLGGGSPSSDCTIGFDGVDVTDGASGVLCVDGDAACDADGATDGSCRFDVALCASVHAPGCTPASVTSVAVAGLPLVVPSLPTGQTRCATATSVTVPVDGVAAATTLARAAGALKDVDLLVLCCASGFSRFAALRCALAVDPAVAGCPASLVPPGVGAAFTRMRAAVAQAADDPTKAPGPLRQIAADLKRVKKLAKRVTRKDACGDALALIARHAGDVLVAARASH